MADKVYGDLGDSGMVARILGMALILILATGCPAKKTKPANPEEVGGGAAATTTDDSIQNKDLSFDAAGSDSGKIDGLYTIHFPYDKSSLNEESRSLLAKNAEWIKNHEGSKVQVEGHCDRHGSIEYNLALGERRAKAIREYLINLGVSSKRLTTISYGKEKPLDGAETDSADGKNRRANFVPSGK